MTSREASGHIVAHETWWTRVTLIGEVYHAGVVYRSSSQQCPRCGIGLELEQSGPHRFDRCPSCLGVWLDPSVALSMLAEMDAPATLELAPSDVTDPVIRCRFCGDDMDKGELHGVLIDRCAEHGHGLWFDGAELQKMLAGSAGLPTELPAGRDRTSLLHAVLTGDRSTD